MVRDKVDKYYEVVNDEQGNLIVTVAGNSYTFRPPKGKDLKLLDQAANQPGATDYSVLCTLVCALCILPNNMTSTHIDEMLAEEVLALGEAVRSFRAFRSLKR